MNLWSIVLWLLRLFGIDLSDDVTTEDGPTLSPVIGTVASDRPTMSPVNGAAATNGPTKDPSSDVAATDGPTKGPVNEMATSDSPTLGPARNLEPRFCGCFECSETILSSNAYGVSCGERIDYLENFEANLYPQQVDACRRVASIEYPTICGPCDPELCDGQTPDPSTRTRFCGCESCSVNDWKSLANPDDGLSCEARVTWLQSHIAEFRDELTACYRIAQDFPLSRCASACDPSKCGWEPPMSLDLYCFPEVSERISYEWGSYLVQVKARDEPCDPGNNKFGPETVSFDDGSLTLRFARVNGTWQASEVRIVPLDGTPYQYGTFRFDIDSVSVQKTSTGEVVAHELPRSLVFGAFTWDDTDNFAVRENYNKEVDVEISKWNVPNNADAQFLVQPDGFPQKKRFFTGNQDGTTEQGGHRYEFTWSPGTITWSTTAGGGQYHVFSASDALAASREDLVQCLPANLDVRLNLWNMLGDQDPPGLGLDEEVVFVLSGFSYEEISDRFRAAGERCTKDCQCESTCSNGFCSPSMRNL